MLTLESNLPCALRAPRRSTPVLVVAVNCMTHGAFERYEQEYNEYGNEIEAPSFSHTNKTTSAFISMGFQDNFRGKSKSIAGMIIAVIWTLPNVAMILDALLEYVYVCLESHAF